MEGGAVGVPIFSSFRDTTWRSRIMINLDEIVKRGRNDTKSCSPFVLHKITGQLVDDHHSIFIYVSICYEIIQLSS